MKNSLADSTREAFAAEAGIACKTGAVIATENCFIIATPDNGKYIIHFRKNGVPVEHFTSPTLGRDMTREEARDALAIIKTCAPRRELLGRGDILVRLESNLPSLGFDTPTPLMTTGRQPPRSNAQTWAWILVNE